MTVYLNMWRHITQLYILSVKQTINEICWPNTIIDYWNSGYYRIIHSFYRNKLSSKKDTDDAIWACPGLRRLTRNVMSCARTHTHTELFDGRYAHIYLIYYSVQRLKLAVQHCKANYCYCTCTKPGRLQNWKRAAAHWSEERFIL